MRLAFSREHPLSGMMNFGRFSALLLEQAALTGPSVLYLLFLARYAGTEDFIVISLGYSIYIVIGTIFDAIILEPMLITTSSRTKDNARYLKDVWTIVIICSALSFLVWISLWYGAGYFALTATALAGGFFPSFSLTAFLRKRLHSEGHAASLPASLAYATAFLLAAVAFYVLHLGSFWVPLPFVVGGMAFVAFARRAIPPRRAASSGTSWLRDHARIAASTAFYAVCANLTLNIYPLIFASLHDAAAIPAFRLASLAFTPFFQAWAAIYNFALPRLQVPRLSDVDPAVRLMLGLVVLAPFAGWLMTIFWSHWIAGLLFGPKYIDLGDLLPVAMSGVCASIVANTIGMWFRSHRGFGAVRLMGFAQLAVTATLAWPISAAWGARGAFATYALANASALALAFVLSWRGAR